MRARLAALAPLVLGAASAAAEPAGDADPAVAAPRVIERARLEVLPAGAAVRRISIDNPLGDVVVEGYDGAAIQIETRKAAPDEGALDRLRISLIPNPDGTVRIATTADRDRELRVVRGAVRVDLRVRAPRGARIEATASTGRLAVSNMDNGGELDTGSGQIEVKNVAGALTTHSVSGPTTLEQVFGSIDAQSLAADLALDSIAGERLVAAASHGRIAGRRVRSRDIELTSFDAPIWLEADAALHGRLVIASLRGNVDLRLRRHGHPVVLRARGARVDLGGTAAVMRPDGWMETRVGQRVDRERPVLLEVRSRAGNVQVVVLD